MGGLEFESRAQCICTRTDLIGTLQFGDYAINCNIKLVFGAMSLGAIHQQKVRVPVMVYAHLYAACCVGWPCPS